MGSTLHFGGHTKTKKKTYNKNYYNIDSDMNIQYTTTRYIDTLYSFHIMWVTNKNQNHKKPKKNLQQTKIKTKL